MGNNKIAKDIANAIQEKFKNFEYRSDKTFADDLRDYVDSGDIFDLLSEESIKEILSHVKTEKTEEGHNLIK